MVAFVKPSKVLNKISWAHIHAFLTLTVLSFVSYSQEIKPIRPYLATYEEAYDEVQRAKGMEIEDYFEAKERTIYNNLHSLSPKNEVALLFYSYEDSTETLNCWILDSKKTIYHRDTEISKQHLLDLEIANLIDIDKNFDTTKNVRGESFKNLKAGQSIPNANKKLSNILFSGDTEQILKSYKTVLIQPVLNLGTIPWYSLRPFDSENDFVVDHWNIQILESLNHLSLADYFSLDRSNTKLSEWSQRQIEDLFIANAVGDSEDSVIYKFPIEYPLIIGNPSFENCNLPSLPGANEEAEYLSNKLGSNYLTGEDAHLEQMLEPAAFGAKRFKGRLIYIASHGISSSTDPMNESVLYLSSTNEQCNPLSAEEIIKIVKKPMTLTILSACQSGLGEIIDGGTVGISRCFIMNRNVDSYPNTYPENENYGGQNVVMSLWSVNDKATSELMQLYIDKLGQPHNYFPVSPLREAILEYRKKDNNPINWSAFQCMGLMFPENWHVFIPMK